MRKLLTAAAILAVASFAMAAETWTSDYAKAVELSKKSGKPIMAFFTGSDWCGWCKKLKSEVLDTNDFMAWAKKNVILLELDYPHAKAQSSALKKQNQALQSKYRIEGFPTVLFLKSDGKVLGSYGYDDGGPKKWTANADKFIKKS
ncbi:MAG: thioredoxin family protein [Armatimonadetes bacterium]|nr:thioredoxin family protein [Armatimonadota bacterium]